MADDWWTPEHEAAALDGFLSNPVAVVYAQAQPYGLGALLPPGGILHIPGQPAVACQLTDRRDTIRVERDGNWDEIHLSGHVATPITEWVPIHDTALEIRATAGTPSMPGFAWRVRIRGEGIGINPC